VVCCDTKRLPIPLSPRTLATVYTDLRFGDESIGRSPLTPLIKATVYTDLVFDDESIGRSPLTPLIKGGTGVQSPPF
jgi:hypothetical protein